MFSSRGSKEVSKVAEDIQIEQKATEDDSSYWMTHGTGGHALLMANRKRSRLNKNKAFNGFVIHENKGGDKSETANFLESLKYSAKHIKPGTRINLAIRVDIEYNGYDY